MAERTQRALPRPLSLAALKPATVRRSNILGSNKDEWGPAGQFVGFFRPPVSSNYSFISAADDLSRVWINVDTRNMSKMHLLLDTRDWMPSRDWYSVGPPLRAPCPLMRRRPVFSG